MSLELRGAPVGYYVKGNDRHTDTLEIRQRIEFVHCWIFSAKGQEFLPEFRLSSVIQRKGVQRPRYR